MQKISYAFLLASALIGLTSLVHLGCAPAEDPPPASVAPAMNSTIAITNLTGTSATVTWPAATSTVTAASSLQYKLVYSSSNNIATAATAESNGTVALAYSTATLTGNITGLTSSTLYYIAVLGKDAAGNVGIATTTTTTLCSGKVIFLTAVANGNLGGSAGADTTCNANKPTGFGASSFKAMLTDNNRRACYSTGNDNCGIIGTTGRVDWVLPASANLCTSSYAAVVGTTNANRFITNINTGVLSPSATVTYTGFNIGWGQSATNCSNFSTTAGTGIAGSANNGMNDFISATIPSCATAGTIYCVEQ